MMTIRTHTLHIMLLLMMSGSGCGADDDSMDDVGGGEGSSGEAAEGLGAEDDGHAGDDGDPGDDGNAGDDGAMPSDDAAQRCVDTINMYRATLDLPPYERWLETESCSDDEARSDSMTGQAHGAFGQCGERAQNECPGWPGPPLQMIDSCLELMWAEGPGEDFNAHGHYINMSSTQYTKVACGFHETEDGSVWAVQNFQ